MSKVSFVIPCYRSSKTIGGVVNEIESTMAQLAYEYEIILVNDSSPDDTFAVISALAEADGVLCGYVGIWKIVDEGHITNVAVSPDYRRRHIARAMLEALIARCGQNGITSYTLEVRVGNEPAIKLYEGLGFTAAGLRKGYYEDNGEDALIMWKGKL